MNSSAVCSLLITLCMILMSHSVMPANGKSNDHGGDLIGQVCKSAMEQRVNCLKILRSEPRILHAKSFLELSTVLLEVALKKGTEAQNFLKQLAATTKSPAIAECANFHYNGVVGSFSSSLRELKEDPQTANYDAKVAGDGPAACNRALAAANIVDPRISAYNNQIYSLSLVAFLATNHLS